MSPPIDPSGQDEARFEALVEELNDASSDDALIIVINEIREHHRNNSFLAARLAQILANSGATLSPPGDLVADVASTGGPTSLSTILCPLFLRASGAIVPKLGVPGHPAGGVDSLAQIPGYNVHMSMREAQSVLDNTGYVHFVAGSDAAPLDARLFEIRRKYGAKAIPTLVAGSLLSKKKAVGIKYAGLDIRVAPHGNFGTDWISAESNAKLYIEASQHLGIEGLPVLTDARYPCQPYIGRSEAMLALYSVLRGEADPWLTQHVSLCQTLATAALPFSVRDMTAKVPASKLLLIFSENLQAQGSEIGAFEQLAVATLQAHKAEIKASEAGYIQYSINPIKKAIATFQSMSWAQNGSFADPVGIRLLFPPGTWVPAGTPLATIRAETRIATEAYSLFHKLLQPCKESHGPLHQIIYG